MQNLTAASLLILLVMVSCVKGNFLAFASTGTLTMSDSSMAPAIKNGDLVVFNSSFPFNDLKVGDVIVFKEPEHGNIIIVHRIAAVYTDVTAQRIIRAKGDASSDSIAGTDFPINATDYIGKVVSNAAPAPPSVTNQTPEFPTSALIGTSAVIGIVIALGRLRLQQS